MNHTPGPWEISRHATPDYAPQYGIYSGDNPNDHCIVKGNEAENDARLIAAAPELLEALRTLCDELHNGRKYNVNKDFSLLLADSAARKAIAKAEGRE